MKNPKDLNSPKKKLLNLLPDDRTDEEVLEELRLSYAEDEERRKRMKEEYNRTHDHTWEERIAAQDKFWAENPELDIMNNSSMGAVMSGVAADAIRKLRAAKAQQG
jgi:DNA primase catalytic subunit